jgi:tRNA pseudouridine38-40 synthase
MTRRVRLVLEYDGTDFCGFQRQSDQPSVQGTLESKLREICGHPVEVVGAGRTDAGVHSLGQVVHFDTTGRIPTERIAPALSSLLGDAIVARHAEETGPEFHARYNARQRTYEYYVDRERPEPALARYVVFEPHLREGAVERMREALPAIVGTHDFATFCAAGSGVESTVRTIVAAEADQDGSMLRVRITANAFLKSMVRIIAGTLIDIGRGRREPDGLRRSLDARNRLAAAMTAPPHGLFLTKVEYPDGYPEAGVLRRVPFFE